MNNSHVAHDCSIGNNTIFANNVAIGGTLKWVIMFLWAVL